MARPALTLLGGLVLTACGGSNSGGINPVSWWHNLNGGPIAEQRPPPPGIDQPYGNLASVPPQPKAPSQAERDAVSTMLAEARRNAEYQAKADPLPAPQPAAAQKPGSGKAAGGPPQSSPPGAPPVGASPAPAPAANAPPPPPAQAAPQQAAPQQQAAGAPDSPPPDAAAQNQEDSGISANMEGATAKPPAASPPSPPVNVPLAQAAQPAAADSFSRPPAQQQPGNPAGAPAGHPLPGRPYVSKGVETGPAPSIPAAPPPPPDLPGLSVPLRSPTPHPVAPPPPPAAPPAPLAGAALRATPVGFLTGSAVLTPDARNEISAYARASGGHSIIAIGYGEAPNDSLQAQQSAMPLALERARAVAVALQSAGIAAQMVRLEAQPLGSGGAMRFTN